MTTKLTLQVRTFVWQVPATVIMIVQDEDGITIDIFHN
jgi:hypothetical protein